MILVETAAGHIKKSEFSTAVGELAGGGHSQSRFCRSSLPAWTGAAPGGQSSPGWHPLRRRIRLRKKIRSRKPKPPSSTCCSLIPMMRGPASSLASLLKARGEGRRPLRNLKKPCSWRPGLPTLILNWVGWRRTPETGRPRSASLKPCWHGIPNNARAHYDLAAALKAGGQAEDAAREMQIAIKLNPGMARPH